MLKALVAWEKDALVVSPGIRYRTTGMQLPLRVVVSGSTYVHLRTPPYPTIALNSLQCTGLPQPPHVHTLPIAQGTKAGFSQARALLQARPWGNLSMLLLPPDSGSYT